MDERIPLTLTINEQSYDLALPPQHTLLDTLRHTLQMTGTKDACGAGSCGACTVLIDGHAVYACLVLAVDCEGSAVTTIEGLARGGLLHPVQQAFIEADALQCGFCTPGQILSVVGLLHRSPDPSEREIVDALCGNLCRCGAYRNILEAARRAARLPAP